MKFMKLGSKPDSFHADGDNIRYVTPELATDIVVNIGDVKFYLHKFPLLSKCARLQKLVATTNGDSNDDVDIPDIPGGPSAFEICAKFCYGMTVTLNAYNVVAARCAAEYLEMYETVDKGNLIYKIEVFLSSSIFRSWKDAIIVFQTTKSFLPLSEELKVVSHCLDSIASKAYTDTSKVEWSYTYNRKKLPSENGDAQWNGVRKQHLVPKDWWVEDLCDLHIDLYKQIITAIRTKEMHAKIIGESLKAYVLRRFPGLSKGNIQGVDVLKCQYLVDTITELLPIEKNAIPCNFLLKLLHVSIMLECGEMTRKELTNRVGRQLDEAAVSDFLVQKEAGEIAVYNIDVVRGLVEVFVTQEHDSRVNTSSEIELEEASSPVKISDAAKGKVAKLVDSYLAEVARDPSLPLSKFIGLAEMVSGFSRPSHDGIYRAIDMYLKEHSGTSKSERKKICKLMDCKKLSVDACMHAVQNERLPLRIVVQVLFFEQMRAASSSGGSSTPDFPCSIRASLPGGSHGSSRSATTNTEEEWDAVPTTEELKTALKGDFAHLRLRDEGGGSSDDNVNDDSTKGVEKIVSSKLRGMLLSKRIFSKLWSNQDGHSENSSSETSESPGSSNAEETKSTPSRSRRHSLS